MLDDSESGGALPYSEYRAYLKLLHWVGSVRQKLSHLQNPNAQVSGRRLTPLR